VKSMSIDAEDRFVELGTLKQVIFQQLDRLA
jgi:hypothetical protein